MRISLISLKSAKISPARYSILIHPRKTLKIGRSKKCSKPPWRFYFPGLVRVLELKNDTWCTRWSGEHLIACNKSFSLTKNLPPPWNLFFFVVKIINCFTIAFFETSPSLKKKSPQNVKISRFEWTANFNHRENLSPSSALTSYLVTIC